MSYQENYVKIHLIMVATVTELLRPKPAAPLHELFRLTTQILKKTPRNYSQLLNNEPSYSEYFDELKGRVKKEKKSVRRFNETLSLLQVTEPHEDFDAVSIRYYGDINTQVRYILYLLTWGYYYDNPDEKIKIPQIIDNYNQQLSSLAESLGGKSTEKISLAELASAIMKGNFDPSFLSKATPLKQL